jgi:hypothetical protein
MELLKEDKNKNIAILTDQELAYIKGMSEDSLTISGYKLNYLRQIADEIHDKDCSKYRNSFCDTFGCGICTGRGYCWSSTIAREILGDKYKKPKYKS